MTLIGAAVFAVIFIVFVFVSLAIPQLPPGSLLHNWFQVLEHAVYIKSIVNGAAYGFVAWLLFRLAHAWRPRGELPLAICPKCGTNVTTLRKSWKMAGRPSKKTDKRVELTIGLYDCTKCGKVFRKVLDKRRIAFVA